MEPLGDSGQFFWHFVSCLYLEWSSKVLLEASGLDFGSISKGLGRILGGFCMDFGRKFGGIWLILGYSGHFEPFKRFSSILQGLGRIWGRFGRDLGKVWEGFGKIEANLQ